MAQRTEMDSDVRTVCFQTLDGLFVTWIYQDLSFYLLLKHKTTAISVSPQIDVSHCS